MEDPIQGDLKGDRVGGSGEATGRFMADIETSMRYTRSSGKDTK
jgi:hypothetical protein